MKNNIAIKKATFIYNPHSGEKRGKNPLYSRMTLEDVKNMLKQYQIPVDYFPSRYAKHATVLARKRIKEAYDPVIAAVGDDTVGWVINGLVVQQLTVAVFSL